MAEKPKVTTAGVVNVSQQYAANQRESRTPAPSYKIPSVIAAPKPATTQTLNLYGTPATSTRPSGGSTQTNSGGGSNQPPKKSTEQILAELQGIDSRLTEQQKKLEDEKKRLTLGASGKTVLRSVTNADGTTTIFYSDGTSETFGTPTTPVKKEIIPNVAYDTIQKILESYRITGLASVLESIRDEYPEINSTELLTLLQFDSRYNAKFNERFAGNVARQKAGKPVLSPGEYLKLEQAYEKVFTSYNLPKFKSQSYYDSFIVSDVDPTEVTERVQLAYDRIMGDDPVLSTFKKFYSSLGFSDIVTGMLDPVNQLPALQQKVKAAEIGGAALRQGLVPSELAATEAQAVCRQMFQHPA